MTVLSIVYCGFRGELAADEPGLAYDEKLVPTIPWLDPAVDRGMWWTLKVHGLKPMYY